MRLDSIGCFGINILILPTHVQCMYIYTPLNCITLFLMFRALASAAAIPVRVFSRPSLLLVSTGLSRYPASMSANRPPFTTATGTDPSLMMEGMGGGGGIDTPTAGGGGAAGTSEYIKVMKETIDL